jgi:uncharacterized UPF0160 family protein
MGNNKKSASKKLVTHNGSFHTDDIFAAAALSILLEKRGETFEIIRTRDVEIIKGGDYVFDVGGVYDPETNRFDHHQVGGAGRRTLDRVEGEAGASLQITIEYSSFGLVWKKFGIELCGSQKVADMIDQKLVSPIDANDNGIDLYKNNFENVRPYTISDVLSIFSGTALEDMDKDKQFLKALVWAKEILQREIKKTNDQIEVIKIIQDFYNNSEDKRLIVIDKPKVSRYEIWEALQDFKEPLFVVYGEYESWSVVAMRKERDSFGNRKNFPESWAGLQNQELQKVTGVSDSIFCHRNLFLAVAKTKEGAIKLAQIAVESL